MTILRAIWSKLCFWFAEAALEVLAGAVVGGTDVPVVDDCVVAADEGVMSRLDRLGAIFCFGVGFEWGGGGLKRVCVVFAP